MFIYMKNVYLLKLVDNLVRRLSIIMKMMSFGINKMLHD